ncbi:MAG: CHAT domain-containing protein [Armatimonadota bacterium]|nr:CHAT domain-containing protein [Armatimonadota bacterium]
MGAPAYLDFHLLVYPSGTGYRAQVVGAPGGDASATFTNPFTEAELDRFVRQLGIGRRRGLGAAQIAARREAAKALGSRLYAAVFAGELGQCLRSSLDQAKKETKGLRIRLNLTDTPELADLPWEFLYDTSLDRFVGLSTETPIVRYLALPQPAEPLVVALPLRVLVVIASPQGHPALDASQEWAKVNDALGDLQRVGRLTLERMEGATLSGLQQTLRHAEYHVLHFIGHGGFDPSTQEGVLLFEDDTGRAAHVSGEELGTLLRDHASMRLVVLNACEGARSSRADPFSGVAQRLVRQGVPSVVAMQFEITDRAAIAFAHEFYRATSDGYPVEAAVAEGRKALATSGPELEWGIPVLHLRAPDGHIFRVDEAGATRPVPATVPGVVTAWLRRVPLWAWTLSAAELLTYTFFSRFFHPNEGEETFRRIVTDYRWQVIATLEACAVGAIALLPWARRQAAVRPRGRRLVGLAGALVLAVIPLGLYAAVRPRAIPEMRVEIFYLDYDRWPRAEGFDEARLRTLLTDAGRRVNVTFNWVDWRDWSTGEVRRTPIEWLSALAAIHARRSGAQASSLYPVGITSMPLGANEFWVGVQGVNLKVISAAGWTAMFAPPSAEEYLLHAIVLTTLEYRLTAAGAPLPPHGADDFRRSYFDSVRDKVQMRELICQGRFTREDERLIRRTLGHQTFDAYREVLSLSWLPETTCPGRRPP